MAARLDNGRVQLLTRPGLDWTNKYPGAAAALANLNVETAYLDGELCGVDDAGLPSFAQTQAATDGERGVSSTSRMAFSLIGNMPLSYSSDKRGPMAQTKIAKPFVCPLGGAGLAAGSGAATARNPRSAPGNGRPRVG
jgi:hypothetical protein